MMATLRQTVSGISRYIDAEILPHLSGYRRYGAAVYLALVMQDGENMLHSLLHIPAIKILGIEDENHCIDMDRLHMAAVSAMGGDKMTIDIPVIGQFTFNSNDVDRLCDYIRTSG